MGEQPTRFSGVRVRSGKIQVDFYYREIRCREKLSLDPTPKNIKYAAQLRAAILYDIESGKFDYAKYFPTSKRVQQFSIKSDITCLELFNNQLQIYKNRFENGNLSKSSMHNYAKEFRAYLIPAFGSIKVVDLTGKHIRQWLYSLNFARKTITNAMIPFRRALKTAVNNGVIAINPLDDIDISEIIQDVCTQKINAIDPFNEDEKQKIINAASGQVQNLIQFGFWSGLRTGELIALRWSDIDFNNELIFVTKSITLYSEKTPKTNAGIRKVVLLPLAKSALMKQLQYTKAENDFIFHNPNTLKRWLDAGKIRAAWKIVLKAADVRYRYPYQMRHTYASTLLMAGENIAWIANQLGHVNTEMVIKTYGKFIPDESLVSGYKLKGNYDIL